MSRQHAFQLLLRKPHCQCYKPHYSCQFRLLLKCLGRPRRNANIREHVQTSVAHLGSWTSSTAYTSSCMVLRTSLVPVEIGSVSFKQSLAQHNALRLLRNMLRSILTCCEDEVLMRGLLDTIWRASTQGWGQHFGFTNDASCPES